MRKSEFGSGQGPLTNRRNIDLHQRQDFLIMAQQQNISAVEYAQILAFIRDVAQTRGVDHVFDTYGVDVIIGPADGMITGLAAGSG